MSPPEHSRAYERLETILAREEYQEYVSPFAWVVRAFEWIEEWFAGLSLALQIVVLGVLLAILIAILFHFVLVFRRVMRATRPAQGRPLELTGLQPSGPQVQPAAEA